MISVKSGVSTVLYDKSIKPGPLILIIMGNVFEIRGKWGFALCQPGEGGKSSRGNYLKWPLPAILLWCGNIQHNCLKQCSIVTIH